MVVGLFVLATVIALTGIPRIHINHNPIDSLGDNSPVRKQIELVNQNLAGLESLSIVVESGIEDTFLKVRYLEELEKLQKFIQEKGWSRSTTRLPCRCSTAPSRNWTNRSCQSRMTWSRS